MTNDEDERQKFEAETNRAKDVEFFAASVNAWYNSALEHDKSIFALSAGSIGLLITLLTTAGVSSAAMLTFYIAAIICFLLCLAAILVIFKRNREHIEQVVARKVTGTDPKLARLDAGAMWLFGAGVVFASAVGITAAFNSYNKGKNMANKKQVQAPLGSTLVQESFNGITNLQKSFNGVAVFQQVTTTQTTATAAQPAAAGQPVAATGTAKPNGK